MTCGYEAPTWAHYPDGRCIDGYLWDLDSGDGEYLTSGGDVPCPCCNAAAYVDYCAHGPGGNSRQRRRWRRVEARKCRAWAIARSTFPCGVATDQPGREDGRG